MMALVVLVELSACRKTPPPETRTAVVSVRVDPRKPNGKPWDVPNQNGEDSPDIAICVSYSGADKICYPNRGAHVETAPVCVNNFWCDVPNVRVPVSGDIEVEVWDIDLSFHDHVCTATCSYGKSCNAPSCAVSIGETAGDLGRATDAGADAAPASCTPTKIDPAVITRLRRTPAAQKIDQQRTSVEYSIYDYTLPQCPAMLQIHKTSPAIWSFDCHSFCGTAESAGIGAVDQLAKFNWSGANGSMWVTWYEVKDGLLKGAFVSVVEEGGTVTALGIQSLGYLKNEKEPGISKWLCERGKLPGVAPTMCGDY